MTIPINFYWRYWLINSLMAIATGFAIGLLTPFPHILTLLALLIYQISIYRHFWGKDKGRFEYQYREYIVEQKLKKFIKNFIGTPEWLWDYPDQHLTDLLANPRIQNDLNLQFLTYLKLSQVAFKGYDDEKEVEFLRKAVSIKPIDLIVNYRLGNALERISNALGAIAAYKSALMDPLIGSAELKDFISSQIKRVETKGPSKKPPVPGLRYMTA